MKRKKSIVILLVVITILFGGIYMRNFFTGEEITQEMLIQEEQERLAEYLIRNYEGVKELEFKDFYIDKKTGYLSSEAIVNKKYKITFFTSGFGGEITIDYYDDFDLIRTSQQSTKLLKDIKISYYLGEKNDK